MKLTALFAAFAALTLPALSHAAPAHHPAVRKPHHAASKAITATRTVTATRSVVAAPAPGQPAGSRPFSDVPPDHWAAAAVETLRQRGIVVGYPAETQQAK